jgi:hypothetical protein
MNSIQIERHVAHRRAQAEKILASPGDYKICTQCLSISVLAASACPLCAGFRFSQDPLMVEVVALHAANFVLPATAGIAPRIGGAKGPISCELKPNARK